MGHVIHRVEQFEIVGPYTLTLRFADGSQQRIDFRPVLEGEIFGPLQNLQIFNTVELDSTFGTLQWPNGADFDPATLHEWPDMRPRSENLRDGGKLARINSYCPPPSR